MSIVNDKVAGSQVRLEDLLSNLSDCSRDPNIGGQAPPGLVFWVGAQLGMALFLRSSRPRGMAVGWGKLTPGIMPFTFCSLSELGFFSYSDKFTRFCQWKNVELNIHVSGLGGCGSWPLGLARAGRYSGCGISARFPMGWLPKAGKHVVRVCNDPSCCCPHS